MKEILLLISILYYQSSFGQLEFKNSNVGRVVNFADLDGHSLLKKSDPDITGSPFINDYWVSAKITLSNGKEIGSLPIKQVFTEGKIELLARKFKYVRVMKNDLSGEISKDFVEGVITLYVYANNIIQQFHPTKSFVLSLLKDKEQMVKLFIDTNKMNLKSIPDLIKLFNYYNSPQ